MTKIEAVILDLDGTVVDHGLEFIPTDKVIESIYRAKKLVSISIATGRPYVMAKHIVDMLGIDKPSVFEGGGQIVQPDSGKIIKEFLIDKKHQLQVLKVAKKYNLEVYRTSAEKALTINHILDNGHTTSKMIVLHMNTKIAFAVAEELNEIKGIAAHPTSTWDAHADHDIHITHEDASKFHSVSKLIKILGVKKENVMAIGDSFNDLPLFEAVGFKVAMGDAPEEVKTAADFVTATLEDDGVAVALDKFVK